MGEGKRRIRPYREADTPKIEWLYSRTPPAGQISARPQALPADLQQIPAYYAHFLVATEMQHGEEVIVGMVGVEAVGTQKSRRLCRLNCSFPRGRHVCATLPSRPSGSAPASAGCWSMPW